MSVRQGVDWEHNKNIVSWFMFLWKITLTGNLDTYSIIQKRTNLIIQRDKKKKKIEKAQTEFVFAQVKNRVQLQTPIFLTLENKEN